MLGGFSGGFLGFGWQAQFGSSLMSKGAICQHFH
jgi:hypothetical protein